MKSIALIKQDATLAGGLEKQTARLIGAFQAKGCFVSLISCSLKKMFSVSKIAAFDRHCSAHLKKHTYDIIFGVDRTRLQTHIRAGNGVHAANLQMRCKAEGFLKHLSFSLNPLHRLLLQIEKESFENPKLEMVFTNSHMVKNQILCFYKVEPEKIHVIHNGVEWNEMEDDFQKWPEVKRQNRRYEFLFIGHNFKRKGLLPLLEALSRLKNRDFHLSVIGKDKNMRWFKVYIEKLKLKNHVTFLGAISPPNLYYQMADSLVIPSIYDPFANVTLEALAMGLFVISSKTNGGHEILTPENGTTFENQDGLISALESGMKKPKTWDSSLQIRNSVSHLDFSSQLEKICALCLY